MAISLRRSRRATKKGVSEYNVGDIVEVRDFGFGSFDTGLDFGFFPFGRPKPFGSHLGYRSTSGSHSRQDDELFTYVFNCYCVLDFYCF